MLVSQGGLFQLIQSTSFFKYSSYISKKLPVKDLCLKEKDKELYDILQEEKRRQYEGIELIASENYAGKAVLQCLGSHLANKYSEGYPNKRYYGGNQFIDKVETLAMNRALKAFRLSQKEWGINVQPYSGSPANLAVYTGVLGPRGKMMGLLLSHGGHLTHGFQTPKKKVSASSLFFTSQQYTIDPETGVVDMEKLDREASEFKPKLIIMGGSAYPRDWDYEGFRQIADKVGAYLMADISHIAGLIAAGLQNDPFKYCDIVTSTTHKTLRGPRSGMIFYSKKKGKFLGNAINGAVFPGLQGGPHDHQIAAIACQMKEVASPLYHKYAKQVIKNSKALAKYLLDNGCRLSSGGTDNHLVLWDVKPLGINGAQLEKTLELVDISCNKNTIAGDRSAVIPGGVRIGTPAVTSRGMKECDIIQIGKFLMRGVKITQKYGDKKKKEFERLIVQDEEIPLFKNDVIRFARQFPVPGIDPSSLLH